VSRHTSHHQAMPCDRLLAIPCHEPMAAQHRQRATSRRAQKKKATWKGRRLHAYGSVNLSRTGSTYLIAKAAVPGAPKTAAFAPRAMVRRARFQLTWRGCTGKWLYPKLLKRFRKRSGKPCFAEDS